MQKRLLTPEINYILDGINAYDGGVRQVLGPNGTAGIFSTYPASYLSLAGGFWDQARQRITIYEMFQCLFLIMDKHAGFWHSIADWNIIRNN